MRMSKARAESLIKKYPVYRRKTKFVSLTKRLKRTVLMVMMKAQIRKNDLELQIHSKFTPEMLQV